MKAHVHRMVPFGELVAAVFDEAATRSKDQREVSRLAMMALAHIVQRARGRPVPRR